jgi:geranylgeranyl pyrophosphate synthase
VEFVIDLALKNALKPELSALNKQLEALANEPNGFLGDLLKYVLIGSGKRVRPALVYLGAKLGTARSEDVRTVEAAVELIHIATLVHDDVIDKAALRRGRKTVVEEQGVDTAVLLGDHIYTFAFQKVAELNKPLILQLLAQSTSIMCAGEIEQLKKRYQFELTEDEYFSFIEKKTASLFGASARSGAILAGQDLNVQVALEKYGIHLGIAFQITDDLLDLTGDEAVVGKTLRTDLLNGKMTLPLIHFRNNLTALAERKDLFEILQNPNGQLSELIGRVKMAGSVEYAENVADHHIQQALSQLNALPPCEARDLLANLAELLHDRKS